MNKPIYTFIMVALLAALGAYVFFFERQPVDPNVPASGKPPAVILALTKNSLKQIELDQNSPSRSTVLKHQGGSWLVDGKPADQARIDALLQQIETWQAADTLEPSFNPVRAAEFGLEPAELILRLDLGSRSETIKIGSKTPTSSGYYLLKQGDPRLYLSYVNVPEELQKLLTQPPLAAAPPAAKASPAVPSKP